MNRLSATQQKEALAKVIDMAAKYLQSTPHVPEEMLADMAMTLTMVNHMKEHINA